MTSDIENLPQSIKIERDIGLVISTKNEISKLQNFSFKELLRLNQSFVWFKCKIGLFESFKKDILTIFYGKAILDDISPENLKFYIEKYSQKLIGFCVVYTDFVIV